MEPLYDTKLKSLATMANQIRQDIIEMLAKAGSGHPGGALGMADVLTALYFHVAHHDPQKPDWPDRDRVVLSNGHICPVLYATLARAGYFPVKELTTLRRINSRLQGHPHRGSLPGIETTSGPLGCGLSQAAGIALAARLDGKKHHVWCLMSDGEHDEGNVWEAAMFVAKERLHRVTVIVDRNNIQIDGYTENIMPLEPFRKKYESFGWHVIDVDGHGFEDIISACAQAKAIIEQPTVIIAHTIPGRGVKFMEGSFQWHGKAPNAEEAKEALRQLKAELVKIKADYN